MKTLLISTITISTATMTFICAYFLKLSMSNFEQYLALAAVVLLDGLFGIVAGAKRDGFSTCKAIKVLRTLFVWILILTTLLIVETGFKGVSWLSETILVPFIVFQFISILKNASMAGFIQAGVLNDILDKIDRHKGSRSN
jgi:phage-related holin